MAKGRRTYRRKSMTRMRRQRGGLPTTIEGNQCTPGFFDMFTGKCKERTPSYQSQSQSSNPLESIGKGAQQAFGTVSSATQGAFKDIKDDFSKLTNKEGVPTQGQYSQANTNLYNQQQQYRQAGGRRYRSTRRRKQSRRRGASRRR